MSGFTVLRTGWSRPCLTFGLILQQAAFPTLVAVVA